MHQAYTESPDSFPVTQVTVSYRDRAVHHALCNIIAPLIEPTFIPDSYSNRIGYGKHKAIRRFTHFARFSEYVLQCDIQKYFPSIDREILKNILRQKIKCYQTLWLIDLIIDNINRSSRHTKLVCPSSAWRHMATTIKYTISIAMLRKTIMTQAIVSPISSTNVTEDKLHWISADLELLPDNGNHYEIINGELYVTRAPHWKHQKTCGRIFTALDIWSIATKLGETATGAGAIFGDKDDVIPDVMWVSKEKYDALIDNSGHLLGAPDIAIEVLSSGTENERRDREVKLKLYSSQGVLEYWIADWRAKQLQIYRRENGILKLAMTLFVSDILTSPLLPDFSCPLSQIFE